MKFHGKIYVSENFYYFGYAWKFIDESSFAYTLLTDYDEKGIPNNSLALDILELKKYFWSEFIYFESEKERIIDISTLYLWDIETEMLLEKFIYVLD